MTAPPSADQSPPAPDSLAALAARHGSRYRWRVLMTVMIGSIASVMSSTIVNVAVPDLMRHFGIGQERAQWVAAGFMAAMTLSMLPTPWLLSRFGYRHTYVGAVTLLMLGGIAGGLAQHYPLVLAMRVAEGLAAGVLQVIPSIIVLRAFDTGERGRAMGIFGFGVVLAPAVGPTVGGVLVEHFGWRSIFFFVVPFALWALWLARRYLPVAAPGGRAPGERGDALDWLGLALASVGVVGLLNGLVHLHDDAPATAAALLASGGIALALFVWHAARARTPLLNLRLFRSRPFAMGGVVAFIYGMGLFGSTYLVPVFMQTALHFPPSQAGAALMPAGLVLALTIPVGGRLADRYPPHALVAVGLALLALSFVLMATVGAGSALWVLMLWAVVGRIGLGFVLPSLTLGAMPGLDADAVPQAASAISFLRQLGGACGVSLVGIFLEWRLRAGVAEGAAPLAGFAQTFWLVAALSAVAMLAALRMKLPRR
jgi:EmrB/QacA subfamily drug resistance transporter